MINADLGYPAAVAAVLAAMEQGLAGYA